jgi:hypothetical protein
MPHWLAPIALLAVVSLGCEVGAPKSDTQSNSPPPRQSRTQAVAPSNGSLSLPGKCALPYVRRRLQNLAADVSAGNGTAVAANFLAGPEFRWEVYEHMDPPNGSKGALRTRAAVAVFASIIRARHTVWTFAGVDPPVGNAGLPETVVYGLSLTIKSGRQERAAGAKVVIDCESGLINHMVGPNDE